MFICCFHLSCCSMVSGLTFKSLIHLVFAPAMWDALNSILLHAHIQLSQHGVLEKVFFPCVPSHFSSLLVCYCFVVSWRWMHPTTSSWPRTHCIAQACSNLLSIFQPQTPECWDCSHESNPSQMPRPLQLCLNNLWRMDWVYIHGFISGSSILFCWSTHVFNVSIIVFGSL